MYVAVTANNKKPMLQLAGEETFVQLLTKMGVERCEGWKAEVTAGSGWHDECMTFAPPTMQGAPGEGKKEIKFLAPKPPTSADAAPSRLTRMMDAARTGTPLPKENNPQSWSSIDCYNRLSDYSPRSTLDSTPEATRILTTLSTALCKIDGLLTKSQLAKDYAGVNTARENGNTSEVRTQDDR